MDSLIPADHFFAVIAALFAIAAFGFWAETKVLGKLMTGTVWAILGGIVLSNLKVIPQASASYDMVFRYFVPLLLPLFLMHADPPYPGGKWPRGPGFYTCLQRHRYRCYGRCQYGRPDA